jgi:phosphoribosylaminoimidazolecarboxamide formyltransferase/IMP cyclohydrolase
VGEPDLVKVRRALVAVADKSGVVAFARALVERGVELVSTGNTARTLDDAGVPVTAVAEVTGFPELLDGRVKTLHPRIHAGILADRRKPEHSRELEEHGIRPFELVVVNLYPFRETVASGADEDAVIEQIDIGGPAMVRAAAKNFESVGIAVDPEAYDEILRAVDAGGLSRELRLRLARVAFEHTAAYDAAVSAWFAGFGGSGADLPARYTLSLATIAGLRYGENPHQRAILAAAEGTTGPLGGAVVLQGKEMSYNNWLDAEAARGAARSFEGSTPVAVIVKHHNPCGVALGATPAEAYERAHACDPVSAFGGIVAFNVPLDEAGARAMAGVFTEVVIAPDYTEGALAALVERQNLRVLRAPLPVRGGLEIRPLEGGALVQDLDAVVEGREDMRIVTSRAPTEEQWEDLLFAWRVAARVKSNAIVLASGLATVGIGAGQMNRVNSVDLAVRGAGERARGSCLASDAFFPFPDGVERAGEAGIAAIIQPGGSVRDDEVLAAAEAHGMAMVLTGRRHFRH